ncbi:DUF4304 domain-containing protein [Pontibacter cellulosilyticus]|uniref:DUF4304 domain-containing protein n=1 Tax=Pontibacter cellulosilyticus TaxID=1720253 RepID=A0A923SJE3_9BACT|nr:DUF4304 domain-containing protein [Pontibacter cellulosilyticus]MBC5992636.1 DUF4304 domain-containing protein [Pontibacter cellulosilyticus]
MTAKEKQKEIIKSYLKPKLKEEGFNTSGMNWWKSKGDFFLFINLQSSSWNSSDNVSFCFNIGVALTARLSDPAKRKATYDDISAEVREEDLLPEDRKKHRYRKDNWLGYLITNDTDIIDFTKELRTDLEEIILPKLQSLNSLSDCINFFEPFGYWGYNLKMKVEELKLDNKQNA